MARTPTYHKEYHKFNQFIIKVFYILGIVMVTPFLSGYLFMGYKLHRKNNVRRWK